LKYDDLKQVIVVCPFCGERKLLCFPGEGRYYVECDSCGEFICVDVGEVNLPPSKCKIIEKM